MRTNHSPETKAEWKVTSCGCNQSGCRAAAIAPNVVRYQGAVDKTNAEFIVRAKEAYEPLVLALRYCVDVRSDPACHESPTERAKRVLEELGEELV